jgi:tetratricopeptide (TPR) repeat protein
VIGPDPIESLTFLLGWVAAVCVLYAAPSVLAENPGLGQRTAIIHAPLIVGSLLCLEPMLFATGEFRAAGPFQLPGSLATWLIMVLPLAIDELFGAKGRTVLLALASSTLAVTTLALTFSRAAWLVTMLELAALALLAARRPPRELLRWAAFAVLGIGCLVLLRHHFTGTGLLLAVAAVCSVPVIVVSARRQLAPSLVARLLLLCLLAGGLLIGARPSQSLSSAAEKRLSTLTGSDQSAVGRLQFWRAALALSVMHPILGVAPGRFSESYPLVQEYYYYYSDSAHGAAVELLSEVGWVGGGLFMVGLALYLERCRPWSHPGQRAPLLGLLMGGLYSQVEVGYHFAIIWTTAAFLLAAALARSPRWTPNPSARPSTPVWLIPPLAGLLWLFFLQRACEQSVRQPEAVDTYREARQVSDLLPIWGKPTLTALAYGLRGERPADELEPLVARALTYAKGDAVTYQLAGEVDLLNENYAQAQAHFTRALELDRFNHPGSYHGLLNVATKNGDKNSAKAIIEQVLAIYDLEKGWAITHLGHRQALSRELRPLLYDIADGLNPMTEPVRTEPIYRFLLRTGREPRALYGLGLALLTQGQAEEGRKLMRQAHDLNPAYPAP